MKAKEIKKKEYLTDFIKNYLNTSISLMKYYKFIATDKKSKNVCNKSIKACENALVRVDQIKHTEILEYFCSMFVGNNAIQHSISGKIIMSKKIKHYDDSEKGFKEFQNMLEEQRQLALERERKRKEELEAINKAKEQGKNVEMVYDEKTKSTRPLVVEGK